MTKTEYTHEFLSLQARGTIALPAALRKKYHLDTPGAQVEIVERPDGVIELRPTLPVPARQAWFWTKEWQDGERVVDEHLANDELEIHGGPEGLVSFLDDLER